MEEGGYIQASFVHAQMNGVGIGANMQYVVTDFVWMEEIVHILMLTAHALKIGVEINVNLVWSYYY